MFSTLAYTAANSLWQFSGASDTRAFRRGLYEPRQAQERLLLSLIRDNATSDYGKRYGFDRIRDVRAYQAAVPIVEYDDLRSDIERIKQGRQGVLTVEPVVMLEKTSGTTTASKFIPYTARLKRQFSAAISPWICDLLHSFPSLRRGGAYWSVSPLGSEREVTEGGIPVGFEEDTEYFGALARRVLGTLILTPPELPRITDMDASRYVTLRLLLTSPHLAFISVWNPSFLTLLWRAADRWSERLIRDIRDGTLSSPGPIPPEIDVAIRAHLRPQPRRAQELERCMHRHGRLVPGEIWSNLSLISCWTDAGAARFVDDMVAAFPGVTIQPKGLLATEGVVSIPLQGYSGSALAVTSHFLEFSDNAAPDTPPFLAHELEVGRTYSVLITTGGGLYRYALGDSVRVTGRIAGTPLVSFVGKAAAVSDVAGEKLHESHVRAALDGVLAAQGLAARFALLAPEGGDPPRYVLYMEATGLTAAMRCALAQALDEALQAGVHYAYCRRLGQLGRVEVVQVQNGAAVYESRCAALGQRRGDIKPMALHRESGWGEWFTSIRPGSEHIQGISV